MKETIMSTENLSQIRKTFTHEILRDSDRKFCWQMEHLKKIIEAERAEAFFQKPKQFSFQFMQ